VFTVTDSSVLGSLCIDDTLLSVTGDHTFGGFDIETEALPRPSLVLKICPGALHPEDDFQVGLPVKTLSGSSRYHEIISHPFST